MDKYFIYLCGLIFCIGLSRADDADDIEYPTLDANWSYCFEYTWFGPNYNNVTTYDGTCDDYLDDTRAGENIPCIAPIVISNDSTLPDVDYLWTYHRASVLCKRAPNQACVTYTYIDNNIIANRSHMCARVRSNEGQVTSGCYKQKSGGYDVEICICQSGYGIKKPCNSGANFYTLTVGILLVGLLANIFTNK
ncbi:uncharacterized protein LOC143204881 [Rhynchophorus ferrugineus]|uniref:uncharacterized protein LOC143204881 n=1 Tax=Rhynchophorus ferrugineus TaxID=354439 RepID=UPI003FCC9AF1